MRDKAEWNIIKNVFFAHYMIMYGSIQRLTGANFCIFTWRFWISATYVALA